jgi:hypothetical protein
MTNSSTRLLLGAVTGLGMAAVSANVFRADEESEALPVAESELLVNREPTWHSESDGRAGDREQLRRYFLQDRRDWRR